MLKDPYVLRTKASEQFEEARQALKLVGITLIQHSMAHYSARAAGWILNIHPGTQNCTYDIMHDVPDERFSGYFDSLLDLTARLTKGREKVELSSPIEVAPPKPVPQLSLDQLEAVKYVKNAAYGECMVLTGPAGSGKSYVINYLIQTMDNVSVTATTGVAAQLIGGTTIHSFAAIDYKTNQLHPSAQADERMRNTKLLILDEASMANVDLVYLIATRCRNARNSPKILLVGDFLQLPPVSGDPLWLALPSWNWTILRLQTQHRQQDMPFLNALNFIRAGILSPEVETFFDERWVDELPDDCVRLMSRRDPVYQYNKLKLDSLPGNRQCYRWRIAPPGKDPDMTNRTVNVTTAEIKQRARFESDVYLKPQAQIMMLNNTSNWNNGTTGIVTECLPFSVRVELKNGFKGIVGVASEAITDASQKTICQVIQLPITLAWAMTIHKAQGSTIDRVGVAMENHFADGMTYVALSRARRSVDLFLSGPRPSSLRCDPRASMYI